MPTAPICILNDLTLSLPLYSPHHFAPHPPVPPLPPPVLASILSPVPASAVELPLPMLWPPGNAVFKNKYATTVRHRFLGVVQAGHDLGIMIPHVQIVPAPNNFLTPLHVLFSSRRMAFSTSMVKADGAFVALGGVAAWPPTPMLVCADPVTFPAGEVPTRWLNTVWIGFTWVDVLAGVLTVVGSMLIDRVLAARKSKAETLAELAKSSRGTMESAIRRKMFPLQKGDDRSAELSKQIAGSVVGLVSVVSTGQVDATITLGSPYSSVTLTVSRNTAGDVTTSVTGQVPFVAEAATIGGRDGGSMKATFSWGSGSATAENSPSVRRVSVHNTFRGRTTSESHSAETTP